MNRLEPPQGLSKKGKIILLALAILSIGIIYLGNRAKEENKIVLPAEQKLLYQFEQAGVWKVDRENHRCLVEVSVWRLFPVEKKEDILKAIYREEGTWWKLQDRYSGKLLGEVDSWGFKVHP